MSVSSFGATTGIGKNRARAANAKDWESIPISKSVTQLRSSTKRGKRVIELSRNQENMVGVPKHSSLTLTVTFGHLCLRQSEHHRYPSGRQPSVKARVWKRSAYEERPTHRAEELDPEGVDDL